MKFIDINESMNQKELTKMTHDSVEKQFLAQWYIIGGALSLFLILSGCSEVKKLDDMRDTTKQMSETTKSMKQNTEKMGQTTEEMKKGTCELYDALRQGDSLSSRRAAIRNVIESRETGRKISEAGKYFMAFEFQFWSEQCQDNSDFKRDLLFDSAVREFLREVQEFFPNEDLDADPAAQSDGNSYSKENLRASLNAISVALHMKNPKQEIREKEESQFKGYSMLDLLKEALAAKPSIESGVKKLEDYPSYVKEVLLQEKFAVALLMARYQMAPAIVLDAISDVRSGFFQKGKMYLFSWTAKLDRLNKAQLQEYKKYLENSIELKKFLKSAGYSTPMDSNFKKVLENMRSPDFSRADVARAKMESDLMKLFREYIQL